MQQENDEKRDYLLTVKAVFHHLDDRNSGTVTLSQLGEHLNDSDVSAYFNRLGVDTDELEKLFVLMDRDFSGTISLEEFMFGCLRLKGHAKSLDLELMHQDLKFAIGTLLDLRATTLGDSLPKAGHQHDLRSIFAQLREMQCRMEQKLAILEPLPIPCSETPRAGHPYQTSKPKRNFNFPPMFV